MYLNRFTLVSGTATDGVWDASGVMPAFAVPGEWTLGSVEVMDRVGRESSNFPTVASLTVTGVADLTDPVADVSTPSG